MAHRLRPGQTRDVLFVARQMYLDGVSDADAGPAWAGAGAAREAATALVSDIAGFEVD